MLQFSQLGLSSSIVRLSYFSGGKACCLIVGFVEENILMVH
ncbi:hypothetical protein PROAA_1540012 [Candidatus Propionivibrio aalborgensis]|uniref:Uncharacterized protein n=1 Tax=Candidatus Propionivibrio aalborgensis TaxID=1860101 RepID=A0A1A8XNB3_9RHOO|nr:hypothetical protein PROAA_1540012 [Candidatus Propionivibrio aalborgensis]